MKSGPSIDLDHQIEQVERRMEIRRRRLQRHVDEFQEAARRRAKPLPLIGLAAFALAGFAWARSLARPRRAFHGGRAERTVASTGLMAAVATTLQLAMQLASSPLVRSAWQAWRARVHTRSFAGD